MATIRDVAREAGVSIGTASRALSGNGYSSPETRRLVWETARRLGYEPKPKASQAGQSGRAIGIVLQDVSMPFFGNFLKYAEFELGNRGCKTFVCNTLGIQNRVSYVLDLVEQHELDGIILNANVTDDELKRLQRLPVVSFDCILGPKIPAVASDNIQGGRIAGRLLLDSGCKNVMLLAALNTTRRYADYSVSECKRILVENGVKVTVAEFNGTLVSLQYAQQVTEQYLSLYKFNDGIFTNDICAYCCVSEALKRGVRIPQDLKIVGYDGNELTKMITPQVTTIVQDIPQLASASVDLLLRKLDGQDVEETTLIPVTLQMGGTT